MVRNSSLPPKGARTLRPRQVKWPDKNSSEYVSPFQRGANERYLRLTLHSETLQELETRELQSLDALHGLATLPGIDVAQTATETDVYPRLSVVPDTNNDLEGHARVLCGRDVVRYGRLPADTKEWFPALVGAMEHEENPADPEFHRTRKELLLGLAHTAVSHDIFVTTSPCLLALRENRDLLRRYPLIAGINPRLPSEALKIVALYLRSRDEYRPNDNSNVIPRIGVSRETFYTVLAYEHLPNMWLYESACGNTYRDTYQLAKSVRIRYARALEARDFLGQLFYTPNVDSITGRAFYHFDYLNLVVCGAFDALARVAHRVYEIKCVNERNAGFHRKDFRGALEQNQDAQALYQVANEQRNRSVLGVPRMLRNNIHGADIKGRPKFVIENPNTAEIEVPDTQACEFWNEIDSLGEPEEWGVSRGPQSSSRQVHPYSILVEPYAYAVKLLEECLPIINEIARTTEVFKLPTIRDRTPLATAPVDDPRFPLTLRREIDLIG